MVYNLTDRALILSDSTYQKNNIKIVNNILLANKYPPPFLNKYIHKRWNLLKNCDYNLTRIVNLQNNVYKNKTFVRVPFKFGFYQKNKKVLDSDKYHVTPLINKDMRKIIKKGKMDNIINKTGVVYKITCKDCPSMYTGETKRPLFMRLDEHNKGKTAVITTHSNTLHHTFNFEKPEVIDEEANWGKRKLSESMQIHLHHQNINLKQDTNNFNDSYIHTINTLNDLTQ